MAIRVTEDGRPLLTEAGTIQVTEGDAPAVPTNYELREDGSRELREDGTFELRE